MGSTLKFDLLLLFVLLFANFKYFCSLDFRDALELFEEADITLMLDERYFGGFGCKKFVCSFNLAVSFEIK